MRRVATLAVALALGCAPIARADTTTPIGGGKALYLLRCGGCHGIQGVSVPKDVPTLRGRAGAFLCNAEGRDYMLRLPNVQMALIRDDADLAAVMNFVAFDLGGRSAPKGAKPFSAAEVAVTRGHPLPTDTIAARRDAAIAEAGACAAGYEKPTVQAPGPY